MYTDMYTDMCVHMCIDMCIDLCIFGFAIHALSLSGPALAPPCWMVMPNSHYYLGPILLTVQDYLALKYYLWAIIGPILLRASTTRDVVPGLAFHEPRLCSYGLIS